MELAKNTIERLVNSLTNAMLPDMLRLTVHEAHEPGPSILTLPAELREMIYEYTLTDTVIRLGSRMWTPSISPAILRTSKGIREEAIPSYYKSATFKVSQWDVLIRLLHPMPQHLRLAVPRIEYVVQMSSKARRDISNYKKEIVYWDRVLNRGLETQAYQLAPPFEPQHTLQLYKMSELPSRLLALPAELREQIYDYAFADTIMVMGGRLEIGLIEGNKTERLQQSLYPSLLATSKQVHQEARFSFYKCSVFRISLDIVALLDWLYDKPSKCRQSITSIEVFHEDLNFHKKWSEEELVRIMQEALQDIEPRVRDDVIQARILKSWRTAIWVGAEKCQL
ncbi:hypothetical protein LTS10_003734 [Elasticomyces elasticus]|nr:hypothetical protein LTS10_003734 [Elasticomyces elasticus]